MKQISFNFWEHWFVMLICLKYSVVKNKTFYAILTTEILKYLLSVVREINFVPDFRRFVLDSLNFHLPEEFRVKVTSREIQISAFPDQSTVQSSNVYHFQSVWPLWKLWYSIVLVFTIIPLSICKTFTKKRITPEEKVAFNSVSILFVDFCCAVVSLKLATNCFQSWFQIDGGNRGVQREFDWSRRWAGNTIKEISRKCDQGNMIKEIPRKYDQGNIQEIWSRKCHQGVFC